MVDRHVEGSRLSAFLDDELGDDDALAVAHHLDICGRCLHELEELRGTRDALRSLPQLQAPVLTAKVDRRSTRGLLARRLRAVAVVLAVPAIALGAAYALGDDRGSVEPPTDLFLVEYLSRTAGGPVPAPVGGQR
jgi:anti-sigma factor RsiW